MFGDVMTIKSATNIQHLIKPSKKQSVAYSTQIHGTVISHKLPTRNKHSDDNEKFLGRLRGRKEFPIKNII